MELMGGIDPRLDLGRDRHLQGSEIGVELCQGRRADDRRGHDRPARDIGDCERGRVELEIAGDGKIAVDRRLGARLLIALAALEQSGAGSAGRVPRRYLPVRQACPSGE